MIVNAIKCELHRLVDEPWPREVSAIPCDYRALICYDLGISFLCHGARLELLEIPGKELEAVGGVTHEVSLEEGFRNDACSIIGKAGVL